MTLSFIDSVSSWLERTFSDIENFMEGHFSSPVMWGAIVVLLLVFVMSSFNSLSKH